MQGLCIALGQSIITRQLIQQTASSTASSDTSLSAWLVSRLRLGLGNALLHGLCQWGRLCGSKVHGLQQRASTRSGRQEALSTCATRSRRGWRQSVDGTRDAHIRRAIAEALRLRVVGLGTSRTLLWRVQHIGGALCARHLETRWCWTQSRLRRLCVLHATRWLRFLLLVLHILWLRLWLRLRTWWQWGGLWAWLLLRTLYTLSSGRQTQLSCWKQKG